MKRIALLLAGICMSAFVFSQAKKPTLMVVPSDLYCNQQGYMQRFDNQGKRSA